MAASGSKAKRTAFAIGAHPDDIEYRMSGTLLLLGEAGYELHYMNVANGCCGTTQYDRETISTIRRGEAMAAAESMGAVFHESLCDDFAIFYDKQTLARLASVLREVAPTILLTHPPVDYMEDHTNTCRLAVSAAFGRGAPNWEVDPLRPAIDTPVTVYHAQPYPNRDPLGQVVKPDIFVDVSDLVARKQAMLAHHKSQKEWLDKSQGEDSYLELAKKLDREVGTMSGEFEYAEGWQRHLHVGFCGEHDRPLEDALRTRVRLRALLPGGRRTPD